MTSPPARATFVRGINPGHQLGTTQQSGAPNITGGFDGNVDDDHMPPLPRKTGAFYTARTEVIGCNGGDYDGVDRGGIIAFDAARVSAVYRNDLAEIRPTNIAVNYIIKY